MHSRPYDILLVLLNAWLLNAWFVAIRVALDQAPRSLGPIIQTSWQSAHMSRHY
jgi:hypothetical protein